MYVQINDQYIIALDAIIQDFIYIKKNKDKRISSTINSDVSSHNIIKVQDLIMLLKHMTTNVSNTTSHRIENVLDPGVHLSGSGFGGAGSDFGGDSGFVGGVGSGFGGAGSGSSLVGAGSDFGGDSGFVGGVGSDFGGDSGFVGGVGSGSDSSISIDTTHNKDYRYVNRLKNVIITTLEQISIALDGEGELPIILKDFSIQDCPICQAKIELTDKVIITECMHPICIDCADSYLEKTYTKCPICRAEYTFK